MEPDRAVEQHEAGGAALPGPGDPLPLMVVLPAPTDAELAALAVAVAALRDAAVVAPAAEPPTPAWSVAGRREAVGQPAPRPGGGWGTADRGGWRSR